MFRVGSSQAVLRLLLLSSLGLVVPVVVAQSQDQPQAQAQPDSKAVEKPAQDTAPAAAQTQPQDAVDPLKRPTDEKQKKKNARALKQELSKPYKKWLDEDVSYIITDEERAAFRQLSNDEERDNFIEAFWQRRDPTPDTEENEFKEEHYQRIAYANEHYAAGVPGWKTDRGRIYIVFGKPDEIDSHPSGGSYERPMDEGGGETSTLIVADQMEAVPTKAIGSGSFVIGTMKVRPRVAPADGKPAIFKRDKDLKLNFWMQVYNLGVDEKTHKPSATFEYNITNIATNKPVVQKTETTDTMGNLGDQVTLQTSIVPANLQPGVYKIQIKVNDNVSKQTVDPSAVFAVE